MGIKLHLPMKSEYYLMVELGHKPEEYRATTPYWCCQLLENRHTGLKYPRIFYEDKLAGLESVPVHKRLDALLTIFGQYDLQLVDVDSIVFHYGYTKRTMEWEVKKLRIGDGEPKWGAKQGVPYFVFELGRRIE